MTHPATPYLSPSSPTPSRPPLKPAAASLRQTPSPGLVAERQQTRSSGKKKRGRRGFFSSLFVSDEGEGTDDDEKAHQAKLKAKEMDNRALQPRPPATETVQQW